MAAPAVTTAEVQTALGVAQGSPRILRAEQTVTATVAHYLIQGGAVYPGVTRWCATTNTDTAAAQATAILAVLVTGNG